MLGLQWADIDLKRSTLTVRHNVVRGQLDLPKGRTEDEIGLTRRSGPFVFDNAGSHFKEHYVKSWLRHVLSRW